MRTHVSSDEAVVHAIVDRDFSLMRQRVWERVDWQLRWSKWLDRALWAGAVVASALAIWEAVSW